MRPPLPYRRVIVDLAKLRYYCLSTEHARGRHKARVFRSRLGLTDNDAQLLRQELLYAADKWQSELVLTERDSHGQRFVLDFEMTTSAGTATLRSGWIILAGERVLRFVTCYVLR